MTQIIPANASNSIPKIQIDSGIEFEHPKLKWISLAHWFKWVIGPLFQVNQKFTLNLPDSNNYVNHNPCLPVSQLLFFPLARAALKIQLNGTNKEADSRVYQNDKGLAGSY